LQLLNFYPVELSLCDTIQQDELVTNMTNYQIKLQDFEGPLELLLTLINDNKLDISKISLTQITDEYLEYINDNQSLDIDEMADFLVVAARLLYIKSKLILPEALNFGEDEDQIELEKQLKIYKEYYQARKIIQQIINQKKFSYSRTSPLIKIKAQFRPPKNIKILDLKTKFEKIINSIQPLIEIKEKRTLNKTISIIEKINYIKSILNNKSQIQFQEILKDQKNKTEIIVSFLALLELIKQKTILVEQKSMFKQIIINTYNHE